MSGGCVHAFVTCPTIGEAEELSKKILDARLAADINVLGGVRRYARAGQAIDCVDESLLIIRTTRDLAATLSDFVCLHHPDEVPDFVVSPIVAGAKDYLNRVNSQTRDF